MDILILLKIIIRRWVVTLPVLGIVLVTGYNTISGLKPQYEAAADVILLSPTQQIDANGKVILGNPFIDFRAGINVTAAIVQTIVTDGPHHEKLADQNLSTDYDITINSAAPIMTITARAEQPDVADGTVTAVANFITEELKSNQDAVNAPPETRVSTRLLTNTKAYPLAGERSRVAAAVGAVGFAAIIGAALLAESVVSGRRRRRGRRRNRHDENEVPTFVPQAPSVPETAEVGAGSAGWDSDESVGWDDDGVEEPRPPVLVPEPMVAQRIDVAEEPAGVADDMNQGPDTDVDRPFRNGRKDREWRPARRRAGAPARPTAPEL